MGLSWDVVHHSSMREETERKRENPDRLAQRMARRLNGNRFPFTRTNHCIALEYRATNG